MDGCGKARWWRSWQMAPHARLQSIENLVHCWYFACHNLWEDSTHVLTCSCTARAAPLEQLQEPPSNSDCVYQKCIRPISWTKLISTMYCTYKHVLLKRLALNSFTSDYQECIRPISWTSLFVQCTVLINMYFWNVLRWILAQATTT
jgi:hypothetical protein